MLNRSALILRYKQPFLDWINAVDPSSAHVVTLADVEQERTVYLIDVEDQAELEDWQALNHEAVFDQELSEWYTDPAPWPAERSLRTLREWCSFEFDSMVLDRGSSPLEDDDL